MSTSNVASVDGYEGCLIEARGLVKSFGPTPALRGADLSVRAGEIVAVMGPSGSGKSTMLHCLAGILVPEEGEVWFSGQRVDAMRETERSALRRDRFGFVFQSGQLVPELTAEENVALPLLLRGVRRSEALRADRDGSNSSTCPDWSCAARVSSPAGRPSGSLWPGRWSAVRMSCSPMSRPGRSTRSPAST